MTLPLPRSLIKLPLFLLYPLHLPFSGGKYYMKCNSDVRVLPPSLCRIRTHKKYKLIGENNTDSSSCCSHFFPWGSEIFFSFSFTLRKWHPEHVPYFVMTFLFLLLPNPPLQYKSTVLLSLCIFKFICFHSLFFPHLPPLAFSSEHPNPPFKPRRVSYFLIPLSNCLYLPFTRYDFSFRIERNRKSFWFRQSFIIIITSHEWSSTFLKRMTVYKCERGGDNGQ